MTAGTTRLVTQMCHVDQRLGASLAVPPLLSVSQTLGVVRRELIADKPPSASSFDSYKLVEAGDLVLNRFNAYKGSLGVARERGIVSPDYATYRPVHSDSGYLEYLLRSGEVASRMKQSMGGIGGSDPDTSGFSRIDLHALERVLVPNRAFGEQLVVRQFLDQETAEIDAFIADQEELIALLTERRAATISHAVTKGLDPTAPMKDSGVKWIGSMPAGWKVAKGSWVGETFGSEPVNESHIQDEGPVAFLKVSSLASGTFELGERQWFLQQAKSLKAGPFLAFPKRGAAIFGNKVNLVDEPSVLDPNLMGWRLRGGFLPRFYAYVLLSIKLEEIADVSTVPQINAKHVDSLRLPWPSSAEQREIQAYLDHSLADIDATISDARDAIALSRERRAALISAAVTGKIDVRGEVAA